MLSNRIQGAFYCPLTKTIDVGRYSRIFSQYTESAGLHPYAVLGHMAQGKENEEKIRLRILTPFTDNADSPGYWSHCTIPYLVGIHGKDTAIEILNTLKTLLLIG